MDTRYESRFLLLLGVLSLAACGVAGTSGPAKPTAAITQDLEIPATVLPTGSVGEDYPAAQLQAIGAVAPVTWMVRDGKLPTGMELTEDGYLLGIPTEKGLSTFDVAATDGWRTAARTLFVAVDTFAIGLDGLHFGEVWSEAPISLIAVGQEGSVAFEIVEGDGGAFDYLDEVAGRAVYLVERIDEPTTHRLRAVDQATGAVAETTLPVLPHPAPDQIAEFGRSDVWYVDCSSRIGESELPRDWDGILHGLGLRSDEFVPTTADRLADWYVRRRVLCELNLFFLRDEGGSQGSGLLISFPFDRPDAPFEAPAPGTWSPGADHRYNVISVLHGRHGGILGMAFADSQANDLIENDSSGGGTYELGVFGNQVAQTFNVAFQNLTLPADPVRADDEPTLRDLIHGRETTGERARLIRRAADNYAKTVAMVLAHEIGHSLGLPHTPAIEHGSIMNGGASVYPGAEYFFLDEDVARLRACLPGPGRAGEYYGEGTTHTPTLPQGGVEPCRLRLLPGNPGACSCDCGHGP
jgi:hypothetical protein